MYLVTGGAGFIGSNLVEALLESGEPVRALENFSAGKRENSRPFASVIDLVGGDIRSYHLVRRAMDGVELMLRQAALPAETRSIADPLTTDEVDMVGTLSVFVAQINAAIGTGVEPKYEAVRLGDVEHLLASLGRAREMLGYESAWPFARGLASTDSASVVGASDHEAISQPLDSRG